MEDFLPKVVCRPCIQHVDLISDFRGRALKTQSYLSDLDFALYISKHFEIGAFESRIVFPWGKWDVSDIIVPDEVIKLILIVS
jgi:hypothetical protein